MSLRPSECPGGGEGDGWGGGSGGGEIVCLKVQQVEVSGDKHALEKVNGEYVKGRK